VTHPNEIASRSTRPTLIISGEAGNDVGRRAGLRFRERRSCPKGHPFGSSESAAASRIGKVIWWTSDSQRSHVIENADELVLQTRAYRPENARVTMVLPNS